MSSLSDSFKSAENPVAVTQLAGAHPVMTTNDGQAPRQVVAPIPVQLETPVAMRTRARQAPVLPATPEPSPSRELAVPQPGSVVAAPLGSSGAGHSSYAVVTRGNSRVAAAAGSAGSVASTSRVTTRQQSRAVKGRQQHQQQDGQYIPLAWDTSIFPRGGGRLERIEKDVGKMWRKLWRKMLGKMLGDNRIVRRVVS